MVIGHLPFESSAISRSKQGAELCLLVLELVLFRDSLSHLLGGAAILFWWSSQLHHSLKSLSLQNGAGTLSLDPQNSYQNDIHH